LSWQRKPYRNLAPKPETSPSPADLATLLAEACKGVEGIDAATFRTLLSPEDVEDIEGGHIPVHTLNAYAKSFAEGIRTGRIRVLLPLIQETSLSLRVRCADCRHFERDTIGDGSGIGRMSAAKGRVRDTRRYGRTPSGSVRTSRRGRTMSKRENVQRYGDRKKKDRYRRV
jgi:hypothetical protein